MIINKQLQRFLKDYSSDAEVIILGMENRKEISHVGMCSTKDGKYKVVLASEKPRYCCKECGEGVYTLKVCPAEFYCVNCDKNKGIEDVTPLNNL